MCVCEREKERENNRHMWQRKNQLIVSVCCNSSEGKGREGKGRKGNRAEEGI